jgi:hypothetical protein
VLPVSGLTLHVREATGADELVVLEPGQSPVATVVTLASRLTADPQGRIPAWEELPAADVGAVALTIRQAWLGARISTDVRCPNVDCLERMDIAFEIHDYLAHHCPQAYPGVIPSPDAGWFALGGTPVSFRLPTIGDLRAALTTPDPEASLRARCVRPADLSNIPFGAVAGAVSDTVANVGSDALSAAVARQVSEAMAALAPSVGGSVTLECPACGSSHELRFDPVSYALTELRDAAAGLYEEVHLLASAFHWTEDAILALPRRRRIRYAELVRRDKATA